MCRDGTGGHLNCRDEVGGHRIAVMVLADVRYAVIEFTLPSYHVNPAMSMILELMFLICNASDFPKFYDIYLKSSI